MATEQVSLYAIPFNKINWKDLCEAATFIAEQSTNRYLTRQDCYLAQDERTIFALFIRHTLWDLWKNKRAEYDTDEIPKILRRISQQLGLKTYYAEEPCIRACCNVFLIHFRRFVNELKSLPDTSEGEYPKYFIGDDTDFKIM